MKQFIKQTFASALGTIIGLILFSALGASAIIVAIIAASLNVEKPQVANKSILVLDLSTPINDSEPPITLDQTISGQTNSVIALRKVVNAIETASRDAKIVGLFIDGRRGGNFTGYATLKEVRQALEKFKKAGKPIYAYTTDWSEPAYYLGSVSTQLYIHPMGGLELNGLNAEQLFFKQALQKYGIGVQVVKVGVYKSAVEPFTRDNYSPADRKQTNELLWSIWGDFLNTVSQSRRISPQQLQKIIGQKGLLFSSEAKKEHLVDRIAYYDELVNELKKLTQQNDNKSSFRNIDIEEYSSIVKEKNKSDDKIAVLYAEGTIVEGEGENGEIGSNHFAQIIREIRQDKAIKALVLRINSPGGSATASEIILRELKLTQKEKPVIISMGNVTASGGYWLSTGGDYIFAQPNTITGSIGVFGLFMNVQKIAKNNGLSWDSVKTGQFADMETISRPKTAQELSVYQGYVNQIYGLFVDKVANSRKLSKVKVEEIAQGRVWSGQSAKNLGLVDELGGLESAIDYAGKKAKLSDWEVEEYPRKKGWEEQFISHFIGSQIKHSTTFNSKVNQRFLEVKSQVDRLSSLNDSKGIYLLFPFQVHLK